jgi:hypothetical protein
MSPTDLPDAMRSFVVYPNPWRAVDPAHIVTPPWVKGSLFQYSGPVLCGSAVRYSGDKSGGYVKPPEPVYYDGDLPDGCALCTSCARRWLREFAPLWEEEI